ncbi:5-oxoprolinase subunit B family protein [Nocardia miyunensis]|uniref:5-oxoprolinase subunit B family protein n=1 Tax=Nocardia miyunensis TaxID=282684 RepID=UPI00082B0FF5|nr:carboxyltransferase domain-containing protein [Nocardia miyunensis]
MIAQAAVHRAGDRGWLVDVPPEHIAALVLEFRRREWFSAIQDLVPAAASILVIAHSAGEMNPLRSRIDCLLGEFDGTAADTRDDGDSVVVPVVYDGEDLDHVSEMLCLDRERIVDAHTTATHRVGFFGFAPGFAYIDGTASQLSMPRRSSPRPRVAAGAVAIAGTQTVVYPGGTPGGWHIIGHTEELLWNIEWDNPSRLAVGDRVTFQAVP